MFSVRLACVKHAASVRPEPGSNSYVKILRSAARFRSPVCTRQRVFYIRLFPALFKEIVFQLLIIFSMFRFQGSSLPVSGQLGYIITPPSACQHPFGLFFVSQTLLLFSPASFVCIHSSTRISPKSFGINRTAKEWSAGRASPGRFRQG